MEGVYAIGDVCDPEFKQAISAAGDAAKAALQAQKYLASSLPIKEEILTPIMGREPEVKKVIEITSKEHFDREISKANTIIFIDFYSNSCGPCRMFAPIYEEWAKEYGGKIKFLKVNADIGRELFYKYHIQAIPTLVILDSKGNVIRKSSGVKEISAIERRLERTKDKMELLPQDFVAR